MNLDNKIFPENPTLEVLIDSVHSRIMRECPKGKNPHRAVRLYVAQYIYARQRGLPDDKAKLEAESRVQIYYQSTSKLTK